MEIALQSRRDAGSRGFTLLEVMLAVAIIGLVAMSIYRFLDTNLQAIQISTELGSQQVELQGLMSVLQAQMNDLPRTEAGALLGEAHKFNNLSSDEIQWTCGPGSGLFTQNGSGEYRVTLALKPLPQSTRLDFGVRRMPVNGTEKDATWLHLMDGVKEIEIRYFDPRLNAWLEKWTDQNARPSLVRIRLSRENDTAPYEQILSLPPVNAGAPGVPVPAAPPQNPPRR